MSNIKVISQYIKDLSFETPHSPEIFLANQGKPDIELSIDIDAKKISDEIYEVILKISANATTKEKKIFLCEVSYAGLFALQNIESEMIEQILLIYCPSLIFPFIRRLIANLTSDSGFPPLMIDPIDFTDLYSKRRKITDSEPISDTKN
jgi:preprotein translocase subunit SecB